MNRPRVSLKIFLSRIQRISVLEFHSLIMCLSLMKISAKKDLTIHEIVTHLTKIGYEV